MKKVSEEVVLGPRTAAQEGTISARDLGVGEVGKVTVRKLHGGRQEGVVEVVVWAGDLMVSVLPTRGMGIWWAKYKGRSMFWKAPQREAVHPMYVNLDRNGGLGWLDGFCEGMVRCGMGWHGAPGVDEIKDNFGNVIRMSLPLHGQMANIPASEVRIGGYKEGKRTFLSVEGTVWEEGVYLDKYELASRTLVEIGGNTIRLRDEVTNRSRERTSPLEMLYHINFGGAALGKGSTMVYAGAVSARDERAAEGLAEQARFRGKVKGFTEQVYWIDLASRPNGVAGTMLVNAKQDFAVYEVHNKKQMKCFAHWKQTGADEYATGFEPGTSLPNNRGVERESGRLEFIGPGETRVFDVEIGALAKASEIRAMSNRLRGK